MIIVETTSGLAGNLVTCLFACTSAGLMKIFWITKGGFAGLVAFNSRFEGRFVRLNFSRRASSSILKAGLKKYFHWGMTFLGMMSICTSREGNLSIFESSDTRYPLLSRCSSCFTKKSEFVLSFLLILIVPCLSTCVIYTSSSNLVARRASSLSSKQGTRSLLSSATWTNHRGLSEGQP